MAAKVILILCAQALTIQCASNRVCRGSGAPFPLGGQTWPYNGVMNDAPVSEPWSRGAGFENFGLYNPTMDYSATTMIPGYETVDPFACELPCLMDGMTRGFNTPFVDPMPPMFNEPMMMEPLCAMAMQPMCPMPMEPMYPMIPEPICPMYNEPIVMEPICPMAMEPVCPMPMEPICPMFPDPMCPMFPDPMCSMITESPMYPMPMPVVEEIVTPVRGCPTIAPSASLSVVVMDSSIQNLFENLWNVHQ